MQVWRTSALASPFRTRYVCLFLPHFLASYFWRPSTNHTHLCSWPSFRSQLLKCSFAPVARTPPNLKHTSVKLTATSLPVGLLQADTIHSDRQTPGKVCDTSSVEIPAMQEHILSWWLAHRLTLWAVAAGKYKWQMCTCKWQQTMSNPISAVKQNNSFSNGVFTPDASKFWRASRLHVKSMQSCVEAA